MIQLIKLSLLALTLTGAFLIACKKENNVELPSELQGNWVLKEMNGEPIDAVIAIYSIPSLHFESNSEAVGLGFCNQWGANTKIDGRRISFSNLTSTYKGCGGQIPELEAEFFSILNSVNQYSIDGNTLILKNTETGNGEFIYQDLIFQKQ